MKIIFDGNISSGKSDSLNHFSNQLNINTLLEQYMSTAQSGLLVEPVDKWGPGLELFYKDKTNAFTLQMEILLWHLQNKNETGFIEDYLYRVFMCLVKV